MAFNRPKFLTVVLIAIAETTLIVIGASRAFADTSTECVTENFCYCVHGYLKDTIEQRIAHIRGLIRGQRRHGKAIGYMSIPLSTVGGSYLPLNTKVATEVKSHIEERFGIRAVWVRNPAAKDVGLPEGASGADYMFMWTRVLGGDDGLGRDFDFVYFVGPSDFARHFSLDGHGDMKKIDSYYYGLFRNPKLAAVDKVLFRNYYGLRASVAFSFGSHDEWNIARAINEKRRSADPKLGIANQLGIFFDGRAVAPGLFETAIAAGNVRKCE